MILGRPLCAAILLAAAISASWPLRAPDAAPAEEGRSLSGKLSGEVRVSGEVRIDGDLTVPAGATLSAAPGTVFLVEKGDSTKVDPEQFYGGTEIVVRGTLIAEGASFRFAGRTGGIVVDGGRARLSGVTISGAEAGLTVLRGGEADIGKTLEATDCRTGLAVFPGGRFRVAPGAGLRASGNGVGWVRFPGADPAPAGLASAGNEEADAIEWEAGGVSSAPAPLAVPAPPATASRMGDTFVDADRTLSGDIVVDGVIRVSPGTTLTLLPGTRLFFTFRDSDGDGIGENGLFLQGNLDARGTKEKRIGLFPAGRDARGAWDSVNFMASDQGENVLAHVDAVGGYRGLHAHFSRFRATDIRIARCYRGMQFQESEVDLSGVTVEDAVSGLRGRDATVRIDGLTLRGAVSGVNLFRSAATLSRIDIDGAGWYGIRFRDSRATLAGGRMSRMFAPLSVQEGVVRVTDVTAAESGLAAFSLLDGDATMEGFRALGSRVDAIGAVNGRASLSGGELSGYRRDAVHLSGQAEIVLKGVKNVSPPGTKNIPVHDARVVPGLGNVRFE
jgi:hypothetical protein